MSATALRSISVAFTKPTNDGGAAISYYRATCTSTTGGVGRSHQAKKSPIVVAGLTAAETYTCTVAAGNRIGVGKASAPSSRVLPRPVAPNAPTITSARASGNRSVTVEFTKPTSDGGTAITSYSVRCTSSNGGATRSRVAPPHSPARVNGLSDGKTYTCTVAASNNVRVGPASKPSKPVVVRSH